MATIPQEEATALLARLREHDVPVGALAKVLDVSVTNMQRWLSGRNRRPPSLDKLLEALIDFREGAKAPQAAREPTHAMPTE